MRRLSRQRHNPTVRRIVLRYEDCLAKVEALYRHDRRKVAQYFEIVRVENHLSRFPSMQKLAKITAAVNKDLKQGRVPRPPSACHEPVRGATRGQR